jgi:S1-C subfamily serine protease
MCLVARLAVADRAAPRVSEPVRVEVAPQCSGDYADDFAALSAKARDLEQKHAPYTYCLRSSATYECPFYGADGTLRPRRKTAVAHGTAFAYRRQGTDTLLLTNEHVSDWPAVTDDEHRADDVPAGCKRVSETLKIVDDESDAFDQDDVKLARVVSDVQLDVAVLKAHASLPVMPWKVGSSSSLKVQNVVHVRGFPLGIFKATNVGKVVSTHDHDEYEDWDHDDFVVDALLSPGNSGSPVLGVSCQTGEFELVGIYHAGYSRGSALNVVVAIDQLRDLMTTLKRQPKAPVDDTGALGAEARAAVEAAIVKQNGQAFFFPFGSMVASARSRSDGALVFEVLNRDFPLRTHPLLVVEDLPRSAAASERIWFGDARGLKLHVLSEIEADVRAPLGRVIEALRRDSYSAANYRAAVDAVASREASERAARIEKTLRKTAASRSELCQTITDLADRFAPERGEPVVARSEIFDAPVAAEAPVVAETSETR